MMKHRPVTLLRPLPGKALSNVACNVVNFSLRWNFHEECHALSMDAVAWFSMAQCSRRHAVSVFTKISFV
jgi:hypothetical protein